MEVRIPEVAELAHAVDDLQTMVVKLLASSREGCLTVSVLDVARLEGVSPSQVYTGGKERYLLPRFGESAYPTGSVRWPLEEYLEWRRKDPKEREMAYRRHLIEKKERTCRTKRNSDASRSTTTRSGTA